MPHHFDPMLPTEPLASVSSEPSTVYSHPSGKFFSQKGSRS